MNVKSLVTTVGLTLALSLGASTALAHDKIISSVPTSVQSKAPSTSATAYLTQKNEREQVTRDASSSFDCSKCNAPFGGTGCDYVCKKGNGSKYCCWGKK